MKVYDGVASGINVKVFVLDTQVYSNTGGQASTATYTGQNTKMTVHGKTVSGKQLMVYTNGGKITLVAWRNSQGVYWISNTLTDDLSNSQIVGIAASLTRR